MLISFTWIKIKFKYILRKCVSMQRDKKNTWWWMKWARDSRAQRHDHQTFVLPHIQHAEVSLSGPVVCFKDAEVKATGLNSMLVYHSVKSICWCLKTHREADGWTLYRTQSFSSSFYPHLLKNKVETFFDDIASRPPVRPVNFNVNVVWGRHTGYDITVRGVNRRWLKQHWSDFCCVCVCVSL